MKAIMNMEYKTFLVEVKERIHKAQHDAFKAVNKKLINFMKNSNRWCEKKTG